MKKPKILVFSGYGLNCEEETKYAFELAGGSAEIVHINDLIEGIKKIKDYEILAFPGGFSYGDDTGSGNAFANKLKNHLWKDLEKFLREDKLVIGICNGFQIIVNLGLLPATNEQFGNREAALLANDNTRYTVRWVDLKVENKSPWFKGIKEISLPIAHGEGKFYAPDEVIEKIKKQNLIAAKYVEGEICKFQNLKANPNGALEDIAAITDSTGKILGIMPHPERAIFFTQLPHWTYLREAGRRNKKTTPKYGPGLQIFKNGVKYFK
jgi:phosphoribosylformylglycinamidine synthase subunit PurQ / glutaminase